MKKNKKILISVIITLGVIFCFGSVFAKQLEPSNKPPISDEATSTKESKVIATTNINEKTTSIINYKSSLEKYIDTYYSAKENVDIKGHFMNDVIVVGNNITIDGIVEGDVLAAGANIYVKANVKGDVRAAGSNIFIEGEVSRNVSVAGGQVNITSTAFIAKDVWVYAGTVNINGPIEGSVKASAGSITLDNSVGGNVDLGESSKIIIGENADIVGNLTYTALSNQALENIESRVMGKVIRSEPKQNTTKNKRKFLSKYTRVSFWVWTIIKLLGLLLVGIITANVCKETTNKVVDNMYGNVGKSFLIGLLIVFLGPLLFILMMLTVVGLPLGLILFLLYGVSLYMGSVFAGAAIGTKLLPTSKSLVSQTFIGLIIFYLIKIIPIVGGIICFILIVWAIGGLFQKKCYGGNKCEVEKIKTKPVIKKIAKPKTRKTTRKKITTKKNKKNNKKS